VRRPLTGPRLSLRGARSVTSGLIALGLIVLLLCAALTAWPRATSSVLTSDLHFRVSGASAFTRDLQSSVEAGGGSESLYNTASPRALDAIWKSVPRDLNAIRAEMPASVHSITAPGRYVGEDGGGGLAASGPPHPPAGASYRLRLEANPQLPSDAQLVSGTWPGPASTNRQAAVPVVIAAKAAQLLDWNVGQTQTLSDSYGNSEVIKLVGTVEPRDDSTDYWQLDRNREAAGAQPSLDGDHTVYSGLVWFDPASWKTVAAVFDGPTVNVWYPVHGNELTASTVSTTVADLHRFLSVSSSIGPPSDRTPALFSTSLPSVASDFLGRAAPASAVLNVVATGPLGTGVAVVLLGIILLADRRRPVLALMRSRGASEARMRATVGGETALASVPGALLGAVTAIWLTPGPIDTTFVVTVVACAILPVVTAIARIGSTRVRPQCSSARRAASMRWVIEVAVLLLTVLSVVLLLQRGSTSNSLGVDPLLTIAPLLVAVVVCLGVIRVYPAVLRAVGSAFRRGRGAVGYVGWATVARNPARFLSIFAVIAGVSITIFSFTILSTERDGIDAAELQKVGADVSVSATPLSKDAPRRIARIPGVARVVPVDVAGGVSLAGSDVAIALFTVDAKQLAALQAHLPPSVYDFTKLGTRVHGHTTVIAGGLQSTPPSLTTLDGPPSIPVHIVKLRGPSPSFVSDPPWILMNRSALPKASVFSDEPFTALIELRPGADTTATVSAIRAVVGPGAVVIDTGSVIRASKSAPVVAGFELLTTAALWFAALMTAIALVLTLLLNTTARIRLLARLRALGFGAGQAAALIAWELGPLAVLGAVAGLLIGLALPALLLRAINLAGFTDSVANPAIVLDPVSIGGTIVGFLVAGAMATLVAIIGGRHAQIAAVLRVTGED
jgi:putative ABC transport system permease protein